MCAFSPQTAKCTLFKAGYVKILPNSIRLIIVAIKDMQPRMTQNTFLSWFQKTTLSLNFMTNVEDSPLAPVFDNILSKLL